ncbi:hypothetical protein CLAIMM_05784 [Cladophialophora immunda]|nr:hypothetical protein CLAIMM_05784 [Cladophialophora immunda]
MNQDSWGKELSKDANNADLIIGLTLPVVAVAHLISQIYQSVGDRANSATAAVVVTDPSQTAQAIEAPFIVTDVFMILSTVMFFVAVINITLRRAVAVAIAGLLCFAAECFAYFSGFTRGEIGRLLSRPFLADSKILIYSLILMLSILIFATVLLVYIFWNYERTARGRRAAVTAVEPHETGIALPDVEPGPSAELVRNEIEELRERGRNLEAYLRRDYLRQREQRAERRRLDQTLGIARSDIQQSRSMRMVSALTCIYLPMTLISSLSSIDLFFFHSIQSETTEQPPRPSTNRATVASYFFPQTPSGWGDLDQVVAMLGGGTVLGFSLYSAVRTRYSVRREEILRAEELHRQNNIRLRRILLQWDQDGRSD